MYHRIKILGLSLVCLVLACTPKVTAPIIEEKPVEVVEVKEDNNPCITFEELSSSRRDGVETAYVLYKDRIKAEQYAEAKPLWEKAYYGAPAANGSIKYQFEDGIKIYKWLYDNESDSAMKQVYADSVMAIYDKRIECFGEPAYIAGRKAFDKYYYYGAHSDEEDTYNLFKEAIDNKKEKSDYFVINPFTKLLSDKIINEEIPIEEGRKYAGLLLNAIDYGTAQGKNKEAWDIINAYAPARLENLEGIEDLYDCAYYEAKYMAQFNEAPTDCEIINRTYGRLLWGGCDKESSSVAEIRDAKKTNCYTPPPAPGPLRQAYDAYTEGRYKEAVQLFDEFIANTSDPAKKFKYSLLVGKIYYGDIKNFVKSRQYARKAAEYNPASGEPYLLIGKLYASSGPLCGPGTGFDSQIVTWPAIDMFNKAKSDPTVSAEAQQFINTYAQYMPSKGDLFQRRLKEGDSYKVGCWINENTTIRAAN